MHVLISILTLVYGPNRGNKNNGGKGHGGNVSEGKQCEIRVEVTCDKSCMYDTRLAILLPERSPCGRVLLL